MILEATDVKRRYRMDEIVVPTSGEITASQLWRDSAMLREGG